MFKHEKIGSYISSIDEGSVFVEIGSDRGENSTIYLADLALRHNTRLLTVDIDPDVKFQDWSVMTKAKKWKDFYSNIKDKTWPENVEYIENLPQDLQRECIEIHNWNDVEEDFIDAQHGKEKQYVSLYDKINHPSIDWYSAQGAEWCRRYQQDIGNPISVLYLDNFDYNWNIHNPPDYVKTQIEQYRQNYDIELNNQNCQIEHFKQMLYLMPFLTSTSIVAFDDTYLYNDCWIGKCGPAVVYLLCQGFEIKYYDKNFVILKRTQQVQSSAKQERLE